MCKKLACVFLALGLLLSSSQAYAADVFFSNRVFVRSQPIARTSSKDVIYVSSYPLVVQSSFGHGLHGNQVFFNNGFATFGQPVFVNQFHSFNSFGQPVVIQNFGGRGGVTVFRNGFCY